MKEVDVDEDLELVELVNYLPVLWGFVESCSEV